jgi:xanthine dehydrogenase small subunit
VRDVVRFSLDGQIHEVANPDPTLTVLRYLRTRLNRCGTKEGCAEGDCGACTVVLADRENGRVAYRAVNACILFLPMIDGKVLFTVESLSANGQIHPVQQAMVDCDASQCGFCTPGFVMSLYAHACNRASRETADINDAIAGNLCRCTGYGPIVRAAQVVDSADVPVSDDRLDDLARLTQDLLALTHLCDLTGTIKKYFAPRTLTELAELSEKHPTATYLAGATDVGLWVTKKHQTLETLISVMQVKELQSLVDNQDAIEIGAAVTYTDAFTALGAVHPDMTELLRRLGALQVRNVGTIGGNIANGSPIGDSMPPLIALGANLVLRKGSHQRTLPLEDYFLSYGKQDRAPGEFVEKVIVPKPGQRSVFHVYKLSKRFDQDISAVCAAMKLEIEDGIVRDARICYGGMAETPKRAKSAERALIGQGWNETTVRAAMSALETDYAPISDMRASSRYRMTAAKNLLYRAFLEAQDPRARTRVLDLAGAAHA